MQFDKINAAKRPATPSTSANSSRNSSKVDFVTRKQDSFVIVPLWVVV
jgi:hypothetical protein